MTPVSPAPAARSPDSALGVLTKLTGRCCRHDKLHPQPRNSSPAPTTARSAAAAAGDGLRRFPGPGRERSGWTANRSRSSARCARLACPPFCLAFLAAPPLCTAQPGAKRNLTNETAAVRHAARKLAAAFYQEKNETEVRA